jgi:hypothetical protein
MRARMTWRDRRKRYLSETGRTRRLILEGYLPGPYLCPITRKENALENSAIKPRSAGPAIHSAGPKLVN